MKPDAVLDAALSNLYAANIEAAYRRVDHVLRNAARGWYAGARADCAMLAAKHGLDIDRVIGAAAAISPGMKWDLVLIYVEHLIRRRKVNVPTYSKLFVQRARQCLAGKRHPLEILGGPKVTAFYALISDPTNNHDVCVDGHAYNIALGQRVNLRGEDSVRVTARGYRLVADAYRQAARKLGLLPHEVQAVTWVAHRRIDTYTRELPL
jgi:hypothetical protein